ncbi:MAG TPA: methylated-DNA--[protein]-cysteine S-methyltransferase [Gemmatimonadaceae bacterium]|nr:methylated-DNA--[protein]-cysteine S-methyltransferase [Gemmatimonadaceae bacterium]
MTAVATATEAITSVEQPVSEDASDYERIAAAIRWSDEHVRQRPGLTGLAAALSLTPLQCQRLFARWVGASPLRTLAHASLAGTGRLLAESRPILAMGREPGQAPGSESAPLLGLPVTLRALSVDEWREGGEVRWGRHPTPFGDAVLGLLEGAVCALSFVDDDPAADRAVQALDTGWPGALVRRDTAATGALVRRIFGSASEEDAEPAGSGSALAVVARGTEFQLRVWEALLRIPAGHAVTYQEVAAGIDRPRAVRAVGAAVARNPVALLIPCHRVIRSTGSEGAPPWGTPRKRVMLAWEVARREDTGDGELSSPLDAEAG